MHFAATLTAAALVITIPLTADAIEGEYRLVGEDMPPGGGRYGGTVDVRQTGDTYQVAWIVGEQVFYGTGILLGDSFGVVFQPETGGPTGQALYVLREDGGLIGVWTILGGQVIGSETWTPKGGL